MGMIGNQVVPAKRPQVSVYLRPVVNEALDKLAATEQRSRSQMAAVLIEEGLRARRLLRDTVGDIEAPTEPE